MGHFGLELVSHPALWLYLETLLGDTMVLLALGDPARLTCYFGTLPKKRSLVTFLRLCGTILISECYAGAQELWAIHRYGTNPGREIVIQRWPPFSDHCLFHVPGYGWMGRD